MPSRLALPLLLAVLALAAWFLFLDYGETPAAEDPQGAAEHAEAAVTAGTRDDAAAAEGATARTTVDDEKSGSGSLAASFNDPKLGIPSFVGRVLRSDGSAAAQAEVRAVGLVGFGGAKSRSDFAERFGADWSTRTRADGRFALPESPRDGLRFELVVLDGDHAPLRLQNLPAWPGRTHDLGDLTLARGFSIAGNVLSPEGAPVAGALIMAYPDLTASSPSAVLGEAEALPLLPAVTDREGEFEIARLGPGRVRLRAESAAGFSPWSAGIGGAEGELVSGVELQLLPVMVLEGIALTPERVGLADIHVRAALSTSLPSPNSSFGLETSSAADGTFRFEVPAALRSVSLRAGGEGTWIAQAGLNRPEEFAKRIELVITPMPMLHGMVVIEPDSPAAGVKVALTNNSIPGRAPDATSIVAETTSAEDGSFSLQVDLLSTNSSRFRVVAWDDEHLPAMSDSIRMRSDGRGFVEPELLLVLSEGLRLSGRALSWDGTPVSGARALLRKLSAPRTNRVPSLNQSTRGGTVMTSTMTGADGSFSFTGLLTGDYRVELHHRAWSPSESEDLPLVESLEGLEVRMHPASGILGEVEGDLRAVAALQVTLSAPGRDPLIAPVDAFGAFVFASVAPDVYALELHPAPLVGIDGVFAFPGGAALGRLDQLEVPSGEHVRAKLKLNLEERGMVTGEVRGGGLAVANYGVYLLKAETTTDTDPRVSTRNAVRSMRATQTDHLGRYSIAGVETGDYQLIVCAPGQSPSGLWNDNGSRDPRGLSRRLIRVEADREARTDFLLRSGTLRVEVSNGDENVNGQQLELMPLATSDEGHRHMFYISRRGSTTGPLPSGAYLLSYGEEPNRKSWQVFIPADSEGSVSITLPERAKRN
ncbi:MAG: carboxypeptidase-like regulatory domain-containing protein [Planctomycetota bacterium]|nr:carboxypeptidase-like regulatory domain-containing protein [Planctomycetota bacterium]